MENFVFHFVFRSICTTFACSEDRRHLGNINEKNLFSFCISLDLHYLCLGKRKNDNMRHYILILLTALLAVMTSCHSNEANYKAAYDKAMQKHQEGIGQEAFDKIQAEARKYTEVVNGDSVRLLRMYANVALDSTSVAKRFNVVVASFKQQFNAQTMRDRLRKEEGFPSYILFGGRDRKYFVVVKAFDEKDVAVAFIKGLDTHMKMPVLEPIPWILERL